MSTSTRTGVRPEGEGAAATDVPFSGEELRVALVVMLGALTPLLDSTIVNIAIGTLCRDLHASVSSVQWVSTGYLLALAMAIPVTGWAVERFGAKRMWLVALTLFLAGSALSGAAWNLGSLIGFRVLQGIGGGLIIPVMQILVFRAANGRPLGRLMALSSLPLLVGPVLGPVIGGLVIDHLDWRWVFYVNAPICVAALVLAWKVLPPDPAGHRRRLDLTGLLLVSPGLAATIYGLAEVGDRGGFGHRAVLVPLISGLLLLAAFAGHALRAAAPLVDLRLFRSRAFAASSALLFLSGLTSIGGMLLLPLYYQQLRGESVLAAGLLLAPQGVGTVLSRGMGALTDRIGPRPVVVAGFVLAAASTVPFALADRHTDLVVLSVALVLRGAGLGACFMAVMVGAFDGLGHDEIPHASTATRIMQQVGGSFGAAVLAVVLQRQLAGHPGVTGAATAFQGTFWWVFALTLLAVVPALALPKVNRSSAEEIVAGSTGSTPISRSHSR